VSSFWVLLTWLSIPVALGLIRMIVYEKGSALNKALAGTGQLELFYSLLFSVGLVATGLMT
jgi:1,4-dihydroxy-2-naphthoate octaprenyltransferase